MFSDYPRLKKELEKKFFGLSFKNIQKHPFLKHLSLTEAEIIDNRIEIKKTILSWNNCGDNENLCNCLGAHYTIKRNMDNQIILETQPCLKKKNYKHLPAELVNEKIQSHIKNSTFNFNYSEVLKNVSDFSNKKLPIIENLGDPKHTINSSYHVCASDIEYSQQYKQQAILNIYLFHATLTNIPIKVIWSSELKTIFTKERYQSNNYERDFYTEKIDSLLNTELLIILGLGREDEYYKKNYYLNILPELLEKRNKSKKVTCIITGIPWSKIIENLKEDRISNNQELQKIKIEMLQKTMELVFF